MSDLKAKLLAAHSAGDKSQLVHLYKEAADQAESDQTAGFYLTHAYVFALELGHPNAPAIRTILVAMGRETAERSI